MTDYTTPIRLLAVDMDDTLVDDSGIPSPEALQAMHDAVAAGVIVTLATGRMYCSALPCARLLGLDLPLITYNGALVRESLSGETLLHTPVSPALCREVAAYCSARGLTLNLYVDDSLKVARWNEEVEYYVQLGGVSYDAVGDLVSYVDKLVRERPGFGGSTKLLIVTDPQRAVTCMPELAELTADRLVVTQSKPKFVELMHPTVSKAAALARLAAGWGVPPESIMAIGDSLNDLEMIRYAGLGVAVGNGVPALKSAARAVTVAHGGLGVAEAIDRYITRGRLHEK